MAITYVFAVVAMQAMAVLGRSAAAEDHGALYGTDFGKVLTFARTCTSVRSTSRLKKRLERNSSSRFSAASMRTTADRCHCRSLLTAPNACPKLRTCFV